MANVIKLVPTQDLTVRKTKAGNSLIIRAIDDILNGKGIDLTEQSGGMHNLHITADSPSILSEDFTINAGDELTVVVADVAAIAKGDIVNGKTYTEDRAAFKQFRVVGYTTLEQRLKVRKASHQIALMDNQLASAKAITAATVEGIKSGKITPALATADDLQTDKW